MISALLLVLLPCQEIRAEPRVAPAARPSAPGRELRLHDASALTGHAELAQAVLALATQGSGPRDAGAEEELARLRQGQGSAEELADGIVAALSARLALAPGEELVHLGAGQLALLAPPAQHERLAVALAQAGGFRGMIRVEARLYFGVELELPVEARERGLVLGEPRASELAREIRGASRELVSAPVVVAHPWREARLAVLDKVPYIKDYTLTLLPDLGEIADPEIEVLELGVELVVRAAPAGEGLLALLIELTHRRLKEPLRDFETTIGRNATPVTIQLALQLVVGFEGSFELGEQETLLLVGGDGDERVALLVQARRVSDAR